MGRAVLNDLLMKQIKMELDQYRRREWQFEKLGDSQACCAYCGRDADGHLEKHHPIGQANSPDWVWACNTCHPSLSDRQYDWPGGLLEEREKSSKELISTIFFALADGLELRDRIGIEKETIGTNPAELAPTLRAIGLTYYSGADNETGSWLFIALMIPFVFGWWKAKRGINE